MRAGIEKAERGASSSGADRRHKGPGSGEAFSGALAEGRELIEAVTFANMAACMSVEVEGVVESIPYGSHGDARLQDFLRSS